MKKIIKTYKFLKMNFFNPHKKKCEFLIYRGEKKGVNNIKNPKINTCIKLVCEVEKSLENLKLKSLEGEKKGVNLDKARDTKMVDLSKINIENSVDLYEFYLKIKDENSVLPYKKELIEMTKLTEHNLRKFNNELKENDLIFHDKNKIIVKKR